MENSTSEYTVVIPLKFPSLNEYVNKCRANFKGANAYKQKIEAQIIPYLVDLPRFEKPIEIGFLWVEENKRRDLDNVAFGKKFILDAMQKSGKLKNDNRKFVKRFTGDDFAYEDTAKVILTIREVEEWEI